MLMKIWASTRCSSWWWCWDVNRSHFSMLEIHLRPSITSCIHAITVLQTNHTCQCVGHSTLTMNPGKYLAEQVRLYGDRWELQHQRRLALFCFLLSCFCRKSSCLFQEKQLFKTIWLEGYLGGDPINSITQAKPQSSPRKNKKYT